MPSPVIEQLRQQFYASMGITETTPISEADAPALIDQWEQYLFSAAQQSRPGPTYGTPSYVPPGQRPVYQPGQIYNLPTGSYVGPPRVGTIAAPPGTGRVTVVQPRVAPVYTGTGTSSGTIQTAPPPRY